MSNESTSYFSCPHCGTDLFFAHQTCHTDVICDGAGNYVDNAKGLMGNDVYDSSACYGPFTCCTCGAEFDCEGNEFDIPNLTQTGHPLTTPNPLSYLDWDLVLETPSYFEVVSGKFPYSMVFDKRKDQPLDNIICMDNAIPIFPVRDRSFGQDDKFVVISLDIKEKDLCSGPVSTDLLRKHIDSLHVAYEAAVSMNQYVKHILKTLGREGK